jgi:hypothetical protein
LSLSVPWSSDLYEPLLLILCSIPDFKGLSGPKTSSPSPISFSSGIEIVASSAKVEFFRAAPGPENNGAGGNGLLGLPPYLEEGVPGLDSPFKSTGSYCTFGGGTLAYSVLALLGFHDLVGEILPLGLYDLVGEILPLGLYDRVGEILPLGLYVLVGELPVGLYDSYSSLGGGIFGAVSIMDGARECDDETEGWYALRDV